jgi:hypothetical protein
MSISHFRRLHVHRQIPAAVPLSKRRPGRRLGELDHLLGSRQTVNPNPEHKMDGNSSDGENLSSDHHDGIRSAKVAAARAARAAAPKAIIGGFIDVVSTVGDG